METISSNNSRLVLRAAAIGAVVCVAKKVGDYFSPEAIGQREAWRRELRAVQAEHIASFSQNYGDMMTSEEDARSRAYYGHPDVEGFLAHTALRVGEE